MVQWPVMSSRVSLMILNALRLAMQHVYGHGGNPGNECADHAAALGSLGLISNHNIATRWVRHTFDTSAC